MQQSEAAARCAIILLVTAPAVLTIFVVLRYCCQTDVLASYVYKQAMQGAQLQSCMMLLQRYLAA